MSARKITREAITAVNADEYHVIFVNYSNLESVASTGDVHATIRAVQGIDKMVGSLAEYVRAKDGVLCITSSLGGAEEMISKDDTQVCANFGKNPVPFIVIGDAYRGIASPHGDPIGGDLSLMSPSGIFADVAPTVLKLLGIDKPEEMTGKTLI